MTDLLSVPTDLQYVHDCAARLAGAAITRLQAGNFTTAGPGLAPAPGACVIELSDDFHRLTGVAGAELALVLLDETSGHPLAAVARPDDPESQGVLLTPTPWRHLAVVRTGGQSPAALLTCVPLVNVLFQEIARAVDRLTCPTGTGHLLDPSHQDGARRAEARAGLAGDAACLAFLHQAGVLAPPDDADPDPICRQAAGIAVDAFDTLDTPAQDALCGFLRRNAFGRVPA